MKLDLSADELLRTTRAVRQRLDLSRPVEPEVIKACIELALQAPSGSNNQNWHFVVVTEADRRQQLGDLYRKGFATYCQLARTGQAVAMRGTAPREREAILKFQASSRYLLEHIHEVPVLIVPCIEDRVDGEAVVEQANAWGSILPATWSFMLAARERGLGTCLTTLHLYHEREAAQVLGLPYERIMQVALIPLAYSRGTTFRQAPRHPVEGVIHWENW
ncbi:nitroreductase [Ktedonosporobacter rubrisoli]|uniref:Nitroreductase n=1 Tax=Ktedonosporobacter rubrisoli TaxID=2509675 RepID=A0A4V0YY85_KTERU|nr:nitroreductase family protein [Ktedonosporobacter rubrisoli]QBD75341.1 nitroreductase [Ktedonosporobacter rubrisoli]